MFSTTLSHPQLLLTSLVSSQKHCVNLKALSHLSVESAKKKIINRFYRHIDPAYNHQNREFRRTFVGISSPANRPERVSHLCRRLNYHTTQFYVRNLLTDSRALEDDPVSSEIIQSRSRQRAPHVAQMKSSLFVHLPTDGQIVPPLYLLTPWCRVLLEKLTGLQLVKKFPAFHGTRRFITALTSVHHLSLLYFLLILYSTGGPGSSVGIATELRAGRSGIESRWGQDFPPVQTGPGAHPGSCAMGTGSFPGIKCGRGVLLTTHPLLVPRSWKSRAIPLPTLWATPGL